MTTARSASQVLKKIGCDKLALYKGEGYWYFEYDDFDATKRYETHSIYTVYLSQLSLETWVQEGTDFVKKMEKMG